MTPLSNLIGEYYQIFHNVQSKSITDSEVYYTLVNNTKGNTWKINKELVKVNKDTIAWIENGNEYKIICYDIISKERTCFFLKGSPDWDGYEFHSFSWIGGVLFCIYIGDHGIAYVHTVANNTEKHICIGTDVIRVFASFLTFQNYRTNMAVYKVSVPELDIIDQYTVSEATALGIMPVSLGPISISEFNFYSL
jgi:hypothetical protein